MADCLFCAIVSKKIPSTAVYEDADTLAFLDIHPLSTGHTVIVPKVHAERLTDAPEGASGSLGLTIKRVSDILHASLSPDGFTIGINDGVGGQQGVPHLHVHVIPRWQGDGGSNIHGIVKAQPRMSLQEVAEKIRAINKQ